MDIRVNGNPSGELEKEVGTMRAEVGRCAGHGTVRNLWNNPSDPLEGSDILKTKGSHKPFSRT